MLADSKNILPLDLSVLLPWMRQQYSIICYVIELLINQERKMLSLSPLVMRNFVFQSVSLHKQIERN